MRLATYASGDGSISFSWTRDDDRLHAEASVSGTGLAEPVTESDVSQFLLEEDASKWVGWDIVLLGERHDRRRVPDVRLARLVRRPFHTSKKLVMDGEEYDYETSGDGKPGELCGWKVSFFQEGREVVNLDVKASLMFFLRHEEDFRASGLETRETR